MLFVMASPTETPLRRIIAEIWPFVPTLSGVLLLQVLFPPLVLWQPRNPGFRCRSRAGRARKGAAAYALSRASRTSFSDCSFRRSGRSVRISA